MLLYIKIYNIVLIKIEKGTKIDKFTSNQISNCAKSHEYFKIWYYIINNIMLLFIIRTGII